MQLGMIGLGRMGANMVRRLEQAGHECVGYDIDTGAVTELTAEGMAGAPSLTGLVELLARPRHVWIMVPGGVRRLDDRRAGAAARTRAT